MDSDRLNVVFEKLQELKQWETVSLFSRSFYELIARSLAEQGTAAASVTLAFTDFLAAEVNYHRRLAALAGRDEMLVGDLQSLADRRRVNLAAITELVANAPADTREVRRLQHLVLAECYYHQHRPRSVVQHLRLAIECGASHHLIHFALGYNLYALAVEDFAVIGSQDAGIIITDQVAFQRYCLVAASAFEASLSGSEFDGQVYWWMAHVLESAGMADAAHDLHDRAAAPDGRHSGDDQTAYLSELDEAAEAPDYLPQITVAEIEQAGKLLRGSFSLSDVLGYEPGED